MAGLGELEPDAIEEVWHGLEAALRGAVRLGRGPRRAPEASDPAPFRPPMLSHAIEDEDFDNLDPKAMIAASGNGTASACRPWAGAGPTGSTWRGSIRAPARTSPAASPTWSRPSISTARVDGELLVLREGRVQSFNVLQQRLNRKSVTPKMLVEFPAHMRAYDLLTLDGEDLRPLPFAERRAHLEAFVAALDRAALRHLAR